MIPRTRLSDSYTISRIIKGGWHLAGDHGAIDPGRAQSDMALFVESGVTTFDCADIYTGVELMIGAFRRSHPSLASQVQIHTKFVPDLSHLQSVDRTYVERGIDRSLARLGVEQLDVVQFHWWDFDIPRYVETALELDRLRRAGKIAHVSATNFDVPHLHELVAAGVPIFTHQIQYSLIDSRAQNKMVDYCSTHDIALLCYGSVGGGFLSERWLGAEEPRELTNRSLIKYKLIIDDFGGWPLFQELLSVLSKIAAKHATDIATVASGMILDRQQVAAVIVGATNASHLKSHELIGSLRLDDEDRSNVDAVVGQSKGPVGDIYDLERDRDGPHSKVMKYELNAAS